jgi:hypothetical protein
VAPPIFCPCARLVDFRTDFDGTAKRYTPSATCWDREFADSPLEGNGFELPVPREIGGGFEASAELEPIDPRGGIIR